MNNDSFKNKKCHPHFHCFNSFGRLFNPSATPSATAKLQSIVPKIIKNVFQINRRTLYKLRKGT